MTKWQHLNGAEKKKQKEKQTDWDETARRIPTSKTYKGKKQEHRGGSENENTREKRGD